MDFRIIDLWTYNEVWPGWNSISTPMECAPQYGVSRDAARMSIVTTYAGAAPEVIGSTGRLATPENANALATELDPPLSDDEQRRGYAKRERLRAQRFKYEFMPMIMRRTFTGGMETRLKG